MKTVVHSTSVIGQAMYSFPDEPFIKSSPQNNNYRKTRQLLKSTMTERQLHDPSQLPVKRFAVPVLKQAACISQNSGIAGSIAIMRSSGLMLATVHSKLAVLKRNDT